MVGRTTIAWKHVRWLAGLLVMLLLALGAPALSERIAGLMSFQLFGAIFSAVPTEQRVVALTFDDGPDPVGTQRVLDVLARHGVPATFFVVGRSVEQHLDAARAIVAAGHELGNHSFSHQAMVWRWPSFIADEIERTDRSIVAAGWKEKPLFRPPFGAKLLLLPWYLYRHDRTTITWSVEPEGGANAQAIARIAIAEARPGSIVLMHVEQPEPSPSFEAIDLIIEGLEAKGYRFATVSELLHARSTR